MSGQPPQRVRRNASPSTKQGPIKATKAFPTVNRSPTRTPGGGFRASSSPISSPISTQRQSPERSSNSPSFKVERPKPLRPGSGSSLKRACSLDTIVTGYLTGQWPKEPTSSHGPHSSQAATGVFMQDRSTQTSDDDISIICDHRRSGSVGSGDHLNKEFIKQRLQRTKEGNKTGEYNKPRQSPVPGSHAALSTPPPYVTHKGIVIPASTRLTQPRHPRSSVEGLNMSGALHGRGRPRVSWCQLVQRDMQEHVLSQEDAIDREIEKLVLHTISDEDRSSEAIPDGHRAPVPDISRSVSSTRSVDTQTPLSVPSHVDDTLSQIECRSQSVSPAIPIMAGLMDNSRPSSRTDSVDSTAAGVDELTELSTLPKYTTSPKPNNSYSFVREPPDGCEKVKVIDETRRPPIKEPLLLAPITTHPFVLKPSDGSAFLPLPKLCLAPDSHLKPPSPVIHQSPGIETQ